MNQVATKARKPKKEPPNQPAPSSQVPMPTARARTIERMLRYRGRLAR